jgi:hypothetical protein
MSGDTSQKADLSARVRHGRAVNAVANYLRSQLRVPNVYIDPSGAGLSRVDVLAADAAGSGDLHAVEVKLLPAPLTQAAMKTFIDQIKKVPAHYKYLALNKNPTSFLIGAQLFSPDGIGRVGLLFLSESDDVYPTVELAIKPERFRMNASELTQIERFLSRAHPDMFVRV